MTLTEILGVSGGALVLLLTLIQVSPIKINPWTAIARAIGRAINGELLKEVRELKAEVARNEIKHIRWEILDFANSCRNNRRHTKEEFDHIIAQHGEYEKLLKETGSSNGQITIAYEYIKEIYKRCLIDNDFLA